MLALAIMLVFFVLVVLAALPFRLVRATRKPTIAAALACGTLFALGLWIDGVPDHLERGITFYAVAFLVSVRFYGWRDTKRARSAHDV